MQNRFKDSISTGEIVGLVQSLKRKSRGFNLPIDIRHAQLLSFDVTRRRAISTIIQNTDGRNWTISFPTWDHRHDPMIQSRQRQTRVRQNTVIERGPGGAKVNFSIYGDYDKFVHDMAICKVFGFLEEDRT